jgi:D-lactate dehydrogenase (cytochrome)
MPDAVATGESVLAQHAHGESWHPPAAPDAVAFVESAEQVATVLRICNRHGAPVVPFGAGSSIEGQVHAAEGGVSLDLSRMTRIRAIHAEDMDCVVEAGVTRQRLNEELRATGLFFPVDLGAEATLGGMAATRASGTTTVRYGTMRDLVLSLEVVTADGRIVTTGGRARKSSAGYDLTRLFIGSEGTLGVITALTLRLFPRPEASRSARLSFETMEAATALVVQALHAGLGLTRIELADALQIAAINRYSGSDLPETPTIFFELSGSEPAVAHDLQILEALAHEAGAAVEAAADREAEARIWALRHAALWATRALKPGAKGISTDVCVPISRLPECIAAISKELERSSIPAPLVGHVGDGNFHLVLLFDPDDPAEFAEAQRLNAALVDIALAMEGTCTGEHGVGLGKKAYLPREAGDALDLMRAVKRALDPKNILNPGKIFDLDPAA